MSEERGAMGEILETITKFVPVIQSSPLWIKATFSIWVMLTAVLIIGVILNKPVPTVTSISTPTTTSTPYLSNSNVVPLSTAGGTANNSSNQPMTWPTPTGHDWVDKSHTELNKLTSRTSYSQPQLINSMRPIFYSAVFKHIYEESEPARALFVFCRAQKILETYLPDFSSPIVRTSISAAIQNLISLQDQQIKIYGPTVDRGSICAQHSNNVKEYMDNLPPRNTERLTGESFNKIQNTLATLNTNLRAVGLTD